MRKLGLLGLFAICVSCNWLESPEERTRKLVSEELAQIDFNDVDQYPLFLNCDETRSKQEQRRCFESTLVGHFAKTLGEFQFQISQPLVDTIYVDFLVDRQGGITILEMNSNAAVKQEIPGFEGIVVRSLRNLPELQPALKRGVPVQAKFRIPIVLNTVE